MIDRELMDAISQLLDVKLTNELGPIKYEIKSIKEEVRGIRDEVREIKAEVKAGREDIKNLSQTVDSLEKRLKKVENVQENDIKQDMRQLFEGQRTTLEKFQSVNEINDRVKDIQGATDVLEVLTVEESIMTRTKSGERVHLLSPLFYFLFFAGHSARASAG